MPRQTSYYQPINVNLRPQDVEHLDNAIENLEDINGTTDAVRHGLLLLSLLAEKRKKEQETDDE